MRALLNCGDAVSAGSRYAPEGDASGLAGRSVAPVSDDAGAVAGRQQHGGCRQHVHERHVSETGHKISKIQGFNPLSEGFGIGRVGGIGRSPLGMVPSRGREVAGRKRRAFVFGKCWKFPKKESVARKRGIDQGRD